MSVRYENCKHADSLIVERNNGFRWVTCTTCLTEFMPQVDREDLLAAVSQIDGAEPDYERAIYAFRTTPFPGSGVEYAENVVRAVVDAALAGRLVIPVGEEPK